MRFIEGSFYMEYDWNLGKAISMFFEKLKDKKIVGARCKECNKVYVPQREVCPVCLKRNELGVEVKDEGIVVSFTEIKMKFPNQPKEIPYKLGLIKLDGADTNLLHVVQENVKIGDRVRVKWKEERIGDIFDIEYFENIS